MITLTAKCKTHPTYKAVLRPRVKCKGCWELFAFVNAVRSAPLDTSSYNYNAVGALNAEIHTLKIER
jgi:hypothetical protein